MAHITGGGFNNINRVLPSTMEVAWKSIDRFYSNQSLFENKNVNIYTLNYDSRRENISFLKRFFFELLISFRIFFLMLKMKKIIASESKVFLNPFFALNSNL